MSRQTFWTYVQPGLLLSLLLVGLVLLSALLYYRSIRIQRYLEPALAMSQPRSEFSGAMMKILRKEFGGGPIRGLDVRTSSIIVQRALLVSRDGTLHDVGRTVLRKLSRVFRALLDDEHLRADTSLVLISAGYPSGGPAAGAGGRIAVQRMLGGVLDELFAAEPVLKARYQPFFATAPRPTMTREGDQALIEFRIIPSEMLHLEVLQRLHKYTR